MGNNFISVVLVLFSILFIGGCQYSEEELFSESQDMAEYNLYALDVLVPEACVDSVKTTLNELQKSENGLDFEYRKFIGVPDAYEIDGYISLKVNEKYPKTYLYDVRVELLSKCYASGSVSIPRNGNEWRNLGEDIEELKRKNITVHSIKINDELIKLFVNMDEYREAIK